MSDQPAFEFETRRHFAVVAFNPSLGECRWGDIEQVGNDIREKLSGLRRPVFLLDLSRLDFIGSSVVALIVKLWKCSQERDGGMVVVNTSNTIQEVLGIAGLARLWTIVGSTAEATEILKKPPYYRPSPRSIYLLMLTGWLAAAAALGVVVCARKGIGNLEPWAGSMIALVCAAVAAICGALTSVKYVDRVWKLTGVLLVFIAGTLAACAFLR